MSGLENARRVGEDLAVQAQRRLRFPFYFPGYRTTGSRYVNDFDRKWLSRDLPTDEPLLGTADLQSLADLNNSLSVVRNMRMAPVSSRLLVGLAVVGLAPVLPLLLFKYPLGELIQKFVATLTGL